jgi:outer membrane lipoprotein-sorting protein
MNEHDPIIESLEQIGHSLRKEPTMKESIMQQIAARQGTSVHSKRPWYVRRTLGAMGAIAACVAMAVLIWSLGGGFDAQKAFAGVINRVKFAKTFSCTQTYESTQNGQTQIISSDRFMFKEPDRERGEVVLMEGRQEGMITIDDFASRRRLTLQPAIKRAELADTSTMYAVDAASGRLQPTKLNTSLRDQILGWSARSTEDLGVVSLEGQSVRLLRSRKGDAIFQVWFDPQTRLPVQITIESPEHGWRWLYTSIQIDQPLDDSLFRVEPPADYQLFRGGLYSPWKDHVGQLFAKMRFLGLKLYEYANDHGDQFPSDLTDLRSVGVSEEILKTAMAPEGQPDAPPIIVYRQPRPGHDRPKEIIFYESFDQWPSKGIAVGMGDGHCEVVAEKSRFDELMR